MNRELPDFQAGFRKGRGTGDQIANIPLDHRKSKRVPENIYFCFIDYAKATVRTGHGKTDWFQIGKEVHQGCILSPC